MQIWKGQRLSFINPDFLPCFVTLSKTNAMRLFLLFVLVGITVHTLNAQSYQGLDAIKFVNAVNDDTVILDYKSSGPLLTIIFTSNFCPYSRKYDDRISDLYRVYSNRDVDFILVNPNNGPDDSLEEMKKKANSQGYNFPYLKDPDQLLTGILGATRTPEVFLLKPVETGFELIYHGALDDNPQASGDVEYTYLKSAIESALQGQPPERAYVKVTGCIIKK